MKRIAAESSDWFVPFLALSAMALSGGPYGDVGRHVTGLLVWLGVLVLVGLLRWPRRAPSRDATWLGTVIALLAVLAAVSMLWSESVERSYLEFTRGSLHLGFFVLAIVVVGRRGSTRSIVDGLSLGAALTIALAALSRLEPAFFPESELVRAFPETAARLSYPFDYWNAVAALAAIAVPLMLFQASRPDASTLRRSLAAGFLPVLGLVIYMTSSRGGLLAAVAATALRLALSSSRWALLRPRALGAVGTALAVLALRSSSPLNAGLTETAAARDAGHWVLLALIAITLACAALARAGERVRAPLAVRVSPALMLGAAGALGAVAIGAFAVGGGLEELVEKPAGGAGSTQARVAAARAHGRTAYWESSVDAFADAPLGGHGAGTWEFWWRRNATLDAPARDAHSVVADAAATLGILGLAGVLAVLGGVLWAGARRWRAERSDLWAALLGGALAFEVSAAVDWTWRFPALTGAFFVIAGLLVARAPGPEPVLDRARRTPPGGTPRALFLIGAWIVVCTQATPLLSSWQLQRSRDAVARGDLAAARDAASTARGIQPWSSSADLQYAQVLEAQGDIAGARAAALEAVRSEETNWRNWYVLARIESRQPDGRVDEYLARAKSLNPRSAIFENPGFSTSTSTKLDPDFVSDDELSSFRGGRPVFDDGAHGGRQSRELTVGSPITTKAQGLTPGRRYEVAFWVKSMDGEPFAAGRVGDTSGTADWGQAAWDNRSGTLRWQRVSVELEATKPTEDLSIVWYSGAQRARVDAVAIRPAG